MAPSDRPSTPRRLLLLLVSALILGSPLFLAAPASAHSALTGSDPKKGATVKTAPAQIRLTFNEEIKPDFITTTVAVGPGKGQKVDATVDQKVVTLAVPDAVRAAGAGKKWTAVFRVVSSDGHPISGEVDFRVAAAPASATPTAPITTTAAPAPSEPSPTTIAAGATADGGDSSPGNLPVVMLVVTVMVIVLIGGVALLARRQRSRNG